MVTEQSAGSDGAVVLIMNADTESGYQLARALLRSGCRVAVTGRYVAGLAKIMHGYNSSRIIAIAAEVADPSQLHQLVDKVEQRFGRCIDAVIRPNGAATPESDYLPEPPSAPLLPLLAPNPPTECPEPMSCLMRLNGLDVWSLGEASPEVA